MDNDQAYYVLQAVVESKVAEYKTELADPATTPARRRVLNERIRDIEQKLAEVRQQNQRNPL